MIRRLLAWYGWGVPVIPLDWFRPAVPRPEPLVVRQRYRRRTVDLLSVAFVENNGIRDAIAGADVKLTGTVLSTDWAVAVKAPPVPFREDLLFDPDDTLELTIVLERRA